MLAVYSRAGCIEVPGGAGDTKGHLVKTKAAKWGNELSQMT